MKPRSDGRDARQGLAEAVCRGSLLTFGVPFLVGRGLKSIYDVMLSGPCHRARLPHDGTEALRAMDTKTSQALKKRLSQRRLALTRA